MCSKAARGILQISGTLLPFIFDSGSECSLIKQSHSDLLKGERFHEQVTLKGVGCSKVVSSLQVKCLTIVQGLSFYVNYYVLPDECLSEDVLLGRDVLENNFCQNK